jgi:outer membrane receptor protein involved in Fe transport
MSASVLVFDDVIQAFDSDREEDARAGYRDAYYWLRLDVGGTADRGGNILAAHTQLSSERRGTTNLPGVGRGSLEDQRLFTINSLQAETWWRPTASSVLQTGAEWRALRGSYRYHDEAQFSLLFLTPGAVREPSRVRTAVLRPEGQQYGAYFNWRVELASTLTADFGVRWDRETLSGDGNGEVSPRAVLLWKPGDDTRLRFSWGRFVQAQGINELAVSDGETRFLPPQRATHLVASLERRLAPGLELRIEAYRKDYDRLLPRYENLLNPLVVLPELKPDRVRVAPQSAQAKGVELSLHYDGEPFSGWLGYSRSQVEDGIDASTVHRSWDQRHYVSSGLTYRRGGWALALAAVWHSGWPATEVELVTLEPLPLVEPGPRNAIRLSDYARIDARLARRFELDAGGDLTLFLEAVNVFKRGNPCCVEYDLEDVDGEISFDVGPRNSLPLIPSIGVIWRF